MLGWDALNPQTMPLFHFEELEAQQMRDQLLDSLPNRLFSLVSEEPITIETMRHMLINDTAARFSDLDEVVIRLFLEKEIEILDPNDKLRSRSYKRLSPTDRIKFPQTLRLPVRGISRRI